MSGALFDRIITLPAITGGQSPVDTLESRVALSNIARLADQSAQVVAAWVHSASLLEMSLTTTHSIVWRSGPMVMRRRDDGHGYRLRVAIAGARSGGTGTIEFIILAVPGSANGSGVQRILRRVNDGATPAEGAARATISSTSSAWLTLDRTWIQQHRPSNWRVSHGRDASQTLDELGGRVVTSTTETQSVVIAARQVTGSGSSASLMGVYAAEYIGP